MTMKHNVQALIAAFVGIFFFGMAFIVLGAILPSLSAQFSLSESQSSNLATLLPVGVLLGSLVFGPIIDRYGYRILLLLATSLGVIGLEVMAFTSLFSMLCVSTLFIGTCGGMLNGSTSALVSDVSDDKTRTSNLFVLGLIYCVGALTIPLILASAETKYGFSPILAIAGIVMALSILYFIIIRFPEAKCKQGISMKAVGEMIKEPVMLLFCFVLFFQSALEGLANNWTTSFLQLPSIGLSNESALYALTFIMIGLGISRAVLSFLSRFVAGKYLILSSMVLTLAGTVCLMTVSNSVMAVVSTILIGMGLAATFPVVLGVIGKKFSSMSGTAFSFALVIALTGNTLLNKLVGWLGVKSLPTVMIVSIILLVVLFLIANRCASKKW